MSNSLRVLGLILLLASSGAAQQLARRQLVVPLAEGGYVSFHLAARGATPNTDAEVAEVQAALVPQALLAERNTIHRVLLDAAGSFVFGYDLTVEPLTPARRFKVIVKPLSPEFEQQLRARAHAASATHTALSAATLPRSAEAQTLDDGDAFELDLLVNPQTGVHVTDVVKVAFDRAPLWQATPRDFAADSVELSVKDYRLTLNDKLIGGGTRPARGCAGSLVWFYVPGRGRFIFSLVPRAGYDFQKTGMILDNVIRFEFKGERYEWISSAPIVGSGGLWYVWLLHDPTYTPEVSSPAEIARAPSAAETDDNWLQDILAGRPPRTSPSRGFGEKQGRGAAARPTERVRIGAADQMENLLPKK